MDRYEKVGNAGSKGIAFQVNLITIFFLNALRKLENWKLSTDNKLAAKFDDVVLEIPNRGAILLQAKHKEHKKITFDQMISINSKNDDFSLPKYFWSYLQVKEVFHVQSVVICTNTDVDKEILKFLKSHTVQRDCMLHYDNEDCLFHTFDDKIIPYLKQNSELYYKTNLQDRSTSDGIVNNEDVKDFLGKLQFFYNYPQGTHISEVVEQLLFHLRQSNELCRFTHSHNLFNKVTRWFEQPHGEYLTETKAKALFCEIRNDKYCEMLEHYNVHFKNSSSYFNESKKIIHFVTSGSCLIVVLK